jgi:hypothetical protein
MKTTHIVTLITLAGLMTMGTSHAGNSNSGRVGANATGWFTRTFGSLSWESAIAVTKSPADISWQVRRHVRYSGGMVLDWEDGRETWDRGYGDCKAFAWCVADLCEAKNIVCWVSLVRPIGEHNGHAVTMGVWEGKLWMSSNGVYGVYESLDHALLALTNLEGFKKKSLEFISFSQM